MRKANDYALDELHREIGEIDRVASPDRYRELMQALRGKLELEGHVKAHCTTGFFLPGWEIEDNLGIVRGLVVRSRSIVGNLAGAVEMMLGGNLSIYQSLCEKARLDAFDRMLDHAAEKGANGVIGVRYDATDMMGGVTEVLCYGTAVKASRRMAG